MVRWMVLVQKRKYYGLFIKTENNHKQQCTGYNRPLKHTVLHSHFCQHTLKKKSKCA